MSEIEDPSKEGTEIYYPDSDGPVKAGLPSDPSARPAGYAEATAKTGIDYGVAPDDLPESGRKTLGDWLVNRTSNNITPVAGGSHPSDASPTVSPVSSTSVLPGNAFVQSSQVKTVYSEDPNAGVTSGDTKMQYGPGGNANTYLRDYEEDHDLNPSGPSYQNPTDEGGDNPAIGNILMRNRFRPGNAWGPEAYRKNTPWAAPQKYTKTNDGNNIQPANSLGSYNKDFDGMTVDELGRIAEHLMLNAVGDTTSGFGNKDAAALNLGNASEGLGFSGILLTKTPTQLGGGKLDANQSFRAANAVGVAVLNDRSKTTNNLGQMATVDDPLAEDDTPSFGVLNNHLEPFGAAMPVSMIVLAAVAALTILVNVLIIALILDVLGVLAAVVRDWKNPGGGFAPPPTYQVYEGDGSMASPADLPMGAAYGSRDFTELGFFDQLYKYLGIPPLDGTYPKFIPIVTASLFGVLEFFIGNSLNGGGGGTRVPQILTNAAGYYTVVTRNAIRDAEQVTKASQEMSGGGFVDAIGGFFALIDAFRSSATFRFCMVMITIGDKIVAGPGLRGKRDNGGVYGLPKNLAGSEPMVIANLHQTIRKKKGVNELAYSYSALPKVFLRPQENFALPDPTNSKYMSTLTSTEVAPNNYVIDDEGNFDLAGWATQGDTTSIGQRDSVYITNSKGELVTFQSRLSYFEGGRINTAFRKSMEAHLDTYYVPFYFHDLRTNEILPLPTFVSNISDSYSPKWSEVEGYGRADNVQIYGGTTRKIGFSFYMVATNEQDYSELYYGINKLVSMVYPQWGGGKSITNAHGQTFQVPYSYVPTASPLIRIRLGELFASNRAPENVRRLFGANKDGFKVGRGDMVPESDASPDESVEPDTLSVIDAGQPLDSSARKIWGMSPSERANCAGLDVQFRVELTQLMGAGGPPFTDYAGGTLDENDGHPTGGVTTMGSGGGKSVFLPAGKVDIAPKMGRYRYVVWNGASYDIVRSTRFKVWADANKGFFKIVNYYVDNYEADPQTGLLKGTFYYVCVPTEENSNLRHWERIKKKVAAEDPATSTIVSGPYLIIPAHKIAQVRVLASPPPLVPNPLAPEPRVPVTDKVFFENNIITKAMEESGGMGLAGAITSLDFDWNEAPWEVDSSIGRAPQFVKVTLSFTPIHDEPLGINSDGSLRAAAYPVGSTVQSVMGSRYDMPGGSVPDDPGQAKFHELMKNPLVAAIVAEQMKEEAQESPSGASSTDL